MAAGEIARRHGYDKDGFRIVVNNGTSAGQSVFHLHVHVQPRMNGVPLLPPTSRKEDPKVLEEHAARLIAALS